MKLVSTLQTPKNMGGQLLENLSPSKNMETKETIVYSELFHAKKLKQFKLVFEVTINFFSWFFFQSRMIYYSKRDSLIWMKLIFWWIICHHIQAFDLENSLSYIEFKWSSMRQARRSLTQLNWSFKQLKKKSIRGIIIPSKTIFSHYLIG